MTRAEACCKIFLAQGGDLTAAESMLDALIKCGLIQVDDPEKAREKFIAVLSTKEKFKGGLRWDDVVDAFGETFR